ncbi:unnamed protein product [Merluccius merluccius]
MLGVSALSSRQPRHAGSLEEDSILPQLKTFDGLGRTSTCNTRLDQELDALTSALSTRAAVHVALVSAFSSLAHPPSLPSSLDGAACAEHFLSPSPSPSGPEELEVFPDQSSSPGHCSRPGAISSRY